MSQTCPPAAPPSPVHEGDTRLVAALHEYLAELEHGQRPDRAVFLARHAEIAAELADCLDGLEFVHAVAPQLSQVGKGELGEQGKAASPLDALGRAVPLGDFRILRELGRGGMGVVYEAEQLSLGRRVALKVLPFAAMLDTRQFQRFKNEAHAAACLHHPHIVPVYAVGYDRGVHYYAMQFIEGESLAEVIRHLQLPMGEVQAPAVETVPIAELSTLRSKTEPGCFRTIARLGIQAAEALAHAHQLGIVHRDIKPGNLLLDRDGNLWVTDFGLAHVQGDSKLTMTGDVVGTLRYMSPEQAAGGPESLDPRTDIYSLGATLYELLTLEPVFAGDDPQVLRKQIADAEPRPLRRFNEAIPLELEVIVLKALGKDPGERYTKAEDVADDLRRFLEDRPIHARPATVLQRTRKWARRHRTAVRSALLVAGTFLLATIGLLVAGIVMIVHEKDEKTAALEQAENNYLEADAARKVALEQRRRARQAVDDMYTRVAERWLRSYVGLEPVQREFLQKALEYYEDFARAQEADLETRQAIAQAQFRVAEIQLRLGNHQPALVAYGGAMKRFQALADEFPTAPNYREQLAACYFSRGEAHARIPKLNECREDWRKAESLYKQLSDERPELRHLRLALSTTRMNLGNLLVNQGRYAEAEVVYRQNREIINELAAQAPRSAVGYRVSLGDSHVNLGLVMRHTERFQEAQQEYLAALALYTELATEDPRTLLYRHRIADCNNNLGMLFRDLGRFQDSEQVFREAIATGVELIEVGPDVAGYRSSLAQYRSNLGMLLAATSRRAEAEVVFREILKLSDNHPLGLQGLAWLLATTPETTPADGRQAVEYAEAALAAKLPQRVALRVLAAAHYRAGNDAAAIENAEKALQAAKDGGSSYEWFFLAMAHARKGNQEEGRRYFGLAKSWMEKKRPKDEELRRIGTEAEALVRSNP